MNKGLKIGLNVFVAIMIVIGVVLCILSFSRGEEGSSIDSSILLVLVQISIAAVIAVVAGLLLFALNIKNRIGALIGFALFAVVGLISYFALADDTTKGFYVPGTEQEITQGTAKLVSTGLNFFYVLIVIAVLAALLGSLWGILKKTVIK